MGNNENKECGDIYNLKCAREKEILANQIEVQREVLHRLIEEVDSVKCEKVLIESQKLDKFLTEYEEFKNE